MTTGTIRDRFDESYKTDPDTGCWEWTAGRAGGKHRYGAIKHKGRVAPAHRISYMIHVGKIGDGLQVLHRCDNPGCVNPSHLFLGSQKDNMTDMASEHRRGLQNEIARAYGVHHSTIRRACSGTTWSHI